MNNYIQNYNLQATPTRGLFSATLGFFVGFTAVALYGVSAKEFKDVMILTATQIGLLVAVPQLTGSLLRIPFGAWVDKVGGKKPFLILLILACIGMGGLSFILLTHYPKHLTNDYYPLMLFFGALSGCGVATFSVGIPQTSYWYPCIKQGQVLGLYAGLGNTAPGIFTILLAICLPFLGLAFSYLVWFVFLLIGTIIYALIAYDAYYFQLTNKGVSRENSIKIAKELGQELIPTGNFFNALKISSRRRKTWILVILYFTSFGGFLALTAWFPTYWRNYHNLSIIQAGIIGGIGFSLAASLIRVYGGYLSDRWGGEKTAIFSYFFILLGALVIMIANSFTLSLIGELFIALGMGVANAAVFKLVAVYVPEAVGGTAGWVGGLGAFGGFLVPPLLGAFVDILGNNGYALGFIIYVFLAIICMIFSIYCKRSSSA